jgi:small subunit ribosomal protein S16
MATTVRLRRIGKNPKKKPHFRITVYSSERGRDSKFIEELGYYNPTSGAVKIDKERFDFWAKKGAVISKTVMALAQKNA